MLVQWHEDFELGHARSDDEHRTVIDLLNELDSHLAAGTPAMAVDHALGRLAETVTAHFRHEESESIDTAHRGEHDELLGRILQLQDDWRAGARNLDHHALMSLARWWLTHVRAHDAGERALVY